LHAGRMGDDLPNFYCFSSFFTRTSSALSLSSSAFIISLGFRDATEGVFSRQHVIHGIEELSMVGFGTRAKREITSAVEEFQKAATIIERLVSPYTSFDQLNERLATMGYRVS
jgi:hypothetical protein